MSAAADRALAVIDVGLQSSTEYGYGTDYHPDRCARCQTDLPAFDGSLCSGCRAFLLGDTDHDPRRQLWVMGADPDPEAIAALAAAWGQAARQVSAAFQRIADAFANWGTTVAEIVAQANALAADRGRAQPQPQLCPRGHGPVKAGLCRRCARTRL